MQTTEKKEEDHGQANARGWSETIAAYVAALNCDYDRLEELRDEKAALSATVAKPDAEDAEAIAVAVKALNDWTEENGEELRDLTEAVTVDGDEFKEREHVEQRIQEAPLSVEVRSGWVQPGDDMQAEDFTILLTTGGPALRIMGELDEHKQPRRAWLEYQDWGTGWTEFHGEGAPSQADLVTFCQCFYFGG